MHTATASTTVVSESEPSPRCGEGGSRRTSLGHSTLADSVDELPKYDHTEHAPTRAAGTIGSPLHDCNRVAELWFEDGSVVIVAEKTAFRVHRSILARHSDILRALLSASGDSDKTEMLDGCPVVRLQDAARDVKQLLLALYDPFPLLIGNDAVEFSMLASIARVAHNYHFEPLLCAVTTRLETVFPKHSMTSQWRATLRKGLESNRSVTVRKEDAIEALNTFRRIGRDDLLPAAFYHCCQLDISLLLRGVPPRAEDGVLIQLSVEDLERCWRLRTTLTNCDIDLFLNAFNKQPKEDCLSAEKCKKIMQDEHTKYLNLCTRIADANPFSRHLLIKLDSSDLCSPCKEMLKENLEEMWKRVHLKFRDAMVSYGVRLA